MDSQSYIIVANLCWGTLFFLFSVIILNLIGHLQQYQSIYEFYPYHIIKDLKTGQKLKNTFHYSIFLILAINPTEE